MRIPEQIIREQNRLQWTKLKHHFTEIIEISFLKEDILRVNIWDAITSVIVDGTEYQKVDYMSVYKGVYRVLPSDAQIHIGIEGLASGEHAVTVKASGYKDCTFTLTVN